MSEGTHGRDLRHRLNTALRSTVGIEIRRARKPPRHRLNTALRSTVGIEIRRVREPPPHHVLVACFMKSGSTYFTALIGTLPHFNVVYLVHHGERREQELDESKLIEYDHLNWVSQHHVRNSTATREFLIRYRVKPVVLVRNIDDVVISLFDHARNESLAWPMAYMREEMLDWDEDRVFSFLVDMALPWYFNFYVSWASISDKLLVKYEELVESPSRTLERVANSLSIDTSTVDLDKLVIQLGDHRKNVGVVGRGAERLSPELRLRIKTMAAYYPGIDFSPIGIES